MSDQTTPTPAIGEEAGDAVTEPTTTSERPEVAEVAAALQEAAAQESAEPTGEPASEPSDAADAPADAAEAPAAEADATNEPSDAAEQAPTDEAAEQAPTDEAAEQAPTDEAAEQAPADEAAAAAATPAPGAPKPGGGGGRGRPAPKPRRAPRPHAPTTRPAVRPPSDPTPWGRMDAEGVVWVRTAEGERQVGTVVDATEAEALAHYGREFDALVAQVDIAEQRLMSAEVAPGEVVGQLRALRGSLADVLAVGDLEGLAQRTRDLEAVAAARREEADAARAAAREAALSARNAIVEEAEQIAAVDPERMQWRPSGDRLRELLDAWKDAQRAQRLDKKSEDDLWKRFSAARTSFDRARRAYFSALEERNSEAKQTKEEIVIEAESLATSTAWGPTSTAYRQLMDRWKAAPRGSRKDDDALWVRFRAAQDAFFAARTAANEAEDESFRGNLAVKEELLVEAEKLLPVTDARSARRALRSIQERWDAAGKVPRADLQRVEKRLRAVEQAVNDAEGATWKRTNPEVKARADSAVQQLERVVADLEADLAAARAKGDSRAEAKAQIALEARRLWLETARRTAEEASG
ncbi:protein of unknown function [Quadrisphaera granulorum]|uniref:Uncharacterized protein DUF349 n=1 Tax=Quadrisphaera granulorum TaxID=317664 RepID=A0A316A6N3_9ACTN|nr:DUF349 domain-containing protein [Quadrisphaera granulorum]PWJ53541.1 uncharacterized protein DUF349 [Quadrisphaera granulorum]SZE96883.1 protein of unknown function [Quadrisphaera granulorum]